MTVKVNKSDIMDPICSASAWRHTQHPQELLLNPDRERLIMQKVGEAYNLLRGRVLGWTSLSSFNPNADEGTVIFTFVLRHPYQPGLPQELAGAIAQALSGYALMSFYGPDTAYYATAWRAGKARLLLTFARDANHDLIRSIRS